PDELRRRTPMRPLDAIPGASEVGRGAYSYSRSRSSMRRLATSCRPSSGSLRAPRCDGPLLDGGGHARTRSTSGSAAREVSHGGASSIGPSFVAAPVSVPQRRHEPGEYVGDDRCLPVLVLEDHRMLEALDVLWVGRVEGRRE